MLKYPRPTLPTLGERIDVLAPRLIERVLGLNLRHQIVVAFQGGDLRVSELAPLLLDFALMTVFDPNRMQVGCSALLFSQIFR